MKNASNHNLNHLNNLNAKEISIKEPSQKSEKNIDMMRYRNLSQNNQYCHRNPHHTTQLSKIP